jgi:hypothetical protein
MPEKTDPQSQNLPLREELKATTLAIIIKTWGEASATTHDRMLD